MLSDVDIAEAAERREIGISPWSYDALQPSSYDVHLADQFLTFAGHAGPIDCARDEPMVPVQLRDDGSFWMPPGLFTLACTTETITLDARHAAIVAGKSSLARRGLVIESAGFIDPGFSGQITLELANLTTRPLVLWPGMGIGQVSFYRLSSPAVRPYGSWRGSHYQGQRGPTASAVHQQVAEWRERVSEAPPSQ